MSESTRDRLVIALLAIMAVAIAGLILTAPTEADRVEKIGTRIKCPVCQGESIANSPADMARDMMALVTERVEAGVPDQQIIDELLASYSGAVLLDPPVGGSTLWLWLAPLAAVLIGVGIIMFWRNHPGTPGQEAEGEPGRGGRVLAGAAILVGSFVAIVVIAGVLLDDETPAAASGVSVDVESLDEASNETLEAVIAANLDHPQIVGMRLALAERYFDVGDYRSAFPHYLAVAESTDAAPAQAVTALVRLGWMAWDGNQETDTALSLFDQALVIDSGDPTATFLKARVLRCGAGQPEEAARLLSEVMAGGRLSEDSTELVENEIAAIQSGQACQ